ncbi:MAG: trigger factor family protein, partial [Patescibacteria group bacterium]
MIQTEIKKLPKSEVEIIGEIPAGEFEKYRAAAVKTLAEHIEVPGFRKGNAPESAIISKVGEMAILEEMAERAIARAYAEILKEHKIDAIGSPKVSITKIAKGSPLGFTIKTAIIPETTLPDYSAIAKEKMAKKDEITVEDKEVDEVITAVRKQRAQSIAAGDEQPTTDDESQSRSQSRSQS